MKAKALELRDEGTFIALLAVDMNAGDPSPFSRSPQRYLLRRCGYPCDDRPNILITKLCGDGSKASNNPYFWGDRTMSVAHNYIIENWDKLRDGDVVDVQFILGETDQPKQSERITAFRP